MKNLKFIAVLFLTSLMTLTSCQDEIDEESGDSPNTNTSNSQTASNLERTSMYDGSFDDFLDGNSCSSILLPVTATVNGTEVTIVNQADYQQVIDILAQFNTDEDIVELQFPVTIRLSNYTEVVVENQSIYEGFIDVCQTLTASGEEAVTCVDIDFPITLLTYSLSLEQTGSVVLETEQQLYAYISDFGDDQLFAINYPITATVDASGNQVVTFNSDAELQAAISDCLNEQGIEEQAAEDADALETILVDGLFQVESVINAGVDTASDFTEFTIDFANDLSVVAENTVNVAVQDVQGTYQVASQTEVFLDLTFTGNITFNLLNQNWAVTSFSNTTISLQSTTNAALTLVLTQI